jgi:hypothetical protein
MPALDALRFAIPSDVVFEVVDGEAVLLNLRKGVYYGLNQTGTRVWQLLEDHHTRSALQRRLLEEFDVGARDVIDDLDGLLSQLLENGLIEGLP